MSSQTSNGILPGGRIHRIARAVIASMIVIAALGLFLVLYLPRGIYDPYARRTVANARATPCASVNHLNVESRWEASEVAVPNPRPEGLFPSIDRRVCGLALSAERYDIDAAISEGCIDMDPSSSFSRLFVDVDVLHHELDAFSWYEHLRQYHRQKGNLTYPHFREYALEDGEAYGVHQAEGSISSVIMRYDRGVLIVGAVSCNDPGADLDGLWTYVASQLDRDAAWIDYYG